MCIYFVICLTTGPQHLPKWLFRKKRSGASYFNLQYPLHSLRSNSSCLHFVPRPPVTSVLPSIFPSVPCLKGSSNVRCDQSSNCSFSLLFEGYSSPLSLSNTSTFLTWSVQLIFSSTMFENFPFICDRLSSVRVSVPYRTILQIEQFMNFLFNASPIFWRKEPSLCRMLLFLWQS